MRTTTMALVFAAAAALPAVAASGDDFAREGDRTNKDPLEGKAPPALRVENWMNVEGDALALSDLRGKVVLLDFWGTW
ncbi:MAG: hypothetical protein R3F34_13875 [Planctomycetota bacterium]